MATRITMKKYLQLTILLSLVGIFAGQELSAQSKPFGYKYRYNTINGSPTRWTAYTSIYTKESDLTPKGRAFFFEGSPTLAEVDRLVFPFKGRNFAGQFFTTSISTGSNGVSPSIPFIVDYGYDNQEDDRRFNYQKVTVAFGDYQENETPEQSLARTDVTWNCNIVQRDCRVRQSQSFNFDRTSVWTNSDHSFAKCIIVRYYMDNKIDKTLILPVVVLGNFKQYLSTGPGPIELYTILRAMPGDESVTFLDEKKTVSSEVTMGLSESNSNSTTVTASVSAGFEAGPFSAKTEVEASKTVTKTKVAGTENTYTVNFTAGSRIENNNAEDDFSDKFIAERRMYDFGVAYELWYSWNILSEYVFINPKSQLIMYPREVFSDETYTEKSLKNTHIPLLEKQKKFSEARYWKQLIQKNDSLKVIARKKKPLQITATTNGRERSVETEKASSLTLSQELTIDKSSSLKVSAEAGISGGGIDVGAKVSVEKTWTFTSTQSSSKTNGTANVVTTGYQLKDNDFTFGDTFVVNRWDDPVMGTPVWGLDESSITSLPYEGGTAADQPDFYVIDPVTGVEAKSAKISDIPEGEEVAFEVVLRNKYQGSGRNYNIRFNPNQGETPDYRFAGGGFGGVSPVFEIGPGGSITTRIRIKNPDKKPQPFKDMMFIMNPSRALPDDQNSDGYVSDTIFLSAFYGGTDTNRVPNNNFIGGAILLPTDGSVKTTYTAGVNNIEFPITNRNATSTEQEQVLVPASWREEVDGKPVISNSVWFKFVTTSPRALISMKHDANKDINFQLAAYQTRNISNTASYTTLGASDYSYSGMELRMELSDLTLGDTVYVLIDGFKGAQSDFAISVAALAPVNDDACKSILLTKFDGNIITGFTNVAATVEDKEQFLIPESNDPIKGWVDGDIKHSVWFRFVAPPTGEAIIEVLNATFDSQIAVFDVGGVCGPTYFSQYTHLAANDALSIAGGLDSKVTLKGLIPGKPYGFMVDGFEGETGNFDIRISAPLPPNDEIENAIELVVDAAGQGVFTNIGSTSSKEEQVITPPTVPLNKPGGWPNIEEEGKRIQHSIWFKFKAPAEGAVQISTCNQASFSVQLALYKIGDLTNYSTYEYLGADSGGSLCRIPPNNDYPNGTSKRGSIINASGLEDGETYYLLVDGLGSSVGKFSIDLLTQKITTPPVNDAPCDAIELPVNGQLQTGYQNFAATKDKSKTGYDLTPTEWLDDEMGGTVWFTFVAPSTGEVEISTCDLANFDTQLAVFILNGCEIDSNAVFIGANEDGPKSCATAGDSYLTLTGLTAGQKYYLVVDGYGGNRGNFSIVLKDKITPGPVNDDVVNAIELPVDGEVKSGYTNAFATVEDDEQNIRPVPAEDQDCTTGWCDNQVDNSVWFKFVAPTDGKVKISTCGLADFDTQLALYEVTDVNDFSTFKLIAANDAGPEECATFFDSFLPVEGLTAGKTYYVLVDGFDGDNGAFSISLTGDVDTQAPSTPTNLTANVVETTSVDITWAASTDDRAVKEYLVYVDGTLAATVTGTSYSITNLTSETTYSITVVAKDDAGNSSSASTALSVTTTKAVDTQAPTSPTGLAATDTQKTTIGISWTASTDNVKVKEYRIYVDGTLTATVTTTTFSITGLTAGTAYSIYVVAVDDAGNVSEASTALKVTTLAEAVVDTTAPSAPTNLITSEITTNSIKVSWTAATDNVGVTEYQLFVDGTQNSTTSTTNATVSNLTKATAYSIYVTAKDAAGNVSAASAALKVTTLDVEIVGIEPDLTNQYLAYPNPFADRIVLEYPGNQLKKGDINVYNLEGQHLLTPNFKVRGANKVEVDLKPLVSGTHIILIKQGSKTVFKKVIKQQ